MYSIRRNYRILKFFWNHLKKLSKMSYSRKSSVESCEKDPLNSLNATTDDGDTTAFKGHQVCVVSARRSIRNLVIISVAYFLYFTGFWSLSNLQSTMNAQQGLGPESQAVIYFCSMVSCLFPQLMIEKFGSKSTFAAALLLSCPYIAANFQLRWDTMMSTSVLYGLASGPLNAAMILYLDEIATRYKVTSNSTIESVKALFFGFNVFFVEITQVLGNSISYAVLEHGKHSHFEYNESMNSSCGILFHPGDVNDNNTNLTPPTENERFMLTGIFLFLGILSVVVALFLDPLKNDVKDVSGCQTLSNTFFGAVNFMKNPLQILLIPLSIFCGIEGAFYANEFTEAFIACSWGVHHVGFVTICFGVCGALMALLVGPLVKCISQMSVILLAAIVNIVTCIMLFVWQPSPESPVAYFAFAGVWGMSDAIWWSQIAALYGLMFPNDREAAFSNFFFWSFLGYFLSYSYANYFSVAVKIYIMLAFLIFGIIGYIIGQVKIKCSRRSGYIAIGDAE